MPRTTSIVDCQRFADSVTAAGGTLPTPLANLLDSYELLFNPEPSQTPERDIMTAATEGTLTSKKLQALLAAAATQQMINNYRGDLARKAEHVLVGAWHRAMETAADEVLDSLRVNFDKHAQAIAKARALFGAESSAEHVLESGQPGTIEAWGALSGHLDVVSKIGAIASAFGPRLGDFSQVVEYTAAENFKLSDAAICCTNGPLVADSQLFLRPNTGHRASPWARCELKLHTISEARERYRAFAEAEFDRVVGSRSPGGWIEDGVMRQFDPPVNPYRVKESAR